MCSVQNCTERPAGDMITAQPFHATNKSLMVKPSTWSQNLVGLSQLREVMSRASGLFEVCLGVAARVVLEQALVTLNTH
jgi:uncharacterized protein YjeT (DUF2065 family)